VHASPLTFEPTSPSYLTSNYTALFTKREVPKKQPGSSVPNLMFEEPNSPQSAGFALRRSSSRGDIQMEASPSSGTMRRKSSTRNVRSISSGPNSGGGLVSNGSFREGKPLSIEPMSGGSMGTPNAFKRQGSFGSGLLSPAAVEPNSSSGLPRKTSFARASKTPPDRQNSGTLTSMGSSQSLINSNTTTGTGGANNVVGRRLARGGDFNASSNTLTKDVTPTRVNEPLSAVSNKSAASPPPTAPAPPKREMEVC
jgi:hypothetical protein